MENETEFEKQLAALSNGMDAAEKYRWLDTLYKQYSDRATKDNDRIWSVTGIFIPLSLAGLGYTKDGTSASIMLLAIGSIALTIFWYVICEKHRLFQERSSRIAKAIEKCIGVDTDVVPIISDLASMNFTDYQSAKSSIKKLRGWITIITIAIWLLTVVVKIS